MEVIWIDVNNIELEKVKDLHLCLGYFDGLHLGHQSLIDKALEKGTTGVMTFDVPPHFALGVNTVNACLSSLYDKATFLEKLGVKYLYVLTMSKDLLHLSREDFVEKVLKLIDPVEIIVGEDYRFGFEAKGTPNYLSNYFNVTVVPLLKINNRKISSRYLKEEVKEGNVKKVSEYLGRFYSITGLVVHGRGNGEKIGFPTANLSLEYPYVLPKIGVYMGYVKLLNSTYKALICVSTHPSIDALKSPIVEVHLLYYKGDLYGREIEVEFVDYMRDVMTFASTDELVEQLKVDRQIAKEQLKG